MHIGAGGWIETFRRNPLTLALGAVSGLVILMAIWRLLSGPAEPAPVGGPEMMRRLTAEQYRATIEDVFGRDIPINARIQQPVRADGLIAIGTGQAGMPAVAVEQYDAAAHGVAAAVLSKARRGKYLSCTPKSERAFDEACARTFLQDVGFRLFRRPLTRDELSLYVGAAHTAQGRLGEFHAGLELALYAMLVSPDFLFRIERAVPDPGGSDGRLTLDAFSRASRLSYFLTNSAPDPELLKAAAEGDLDSHWGLGRQVDRLMASPRFEGAVRAFFADMMQFDRFSSLSKDPKIYPAYSSQLAADAQEQTLRTIVELLVRENGDYRDIFTTRRTYLTRPLGIVYRMPVAARNGWEEAEFDPASGRAGIQSHVSFLAAHSHPGRSSPTLRGYAAREIFLCQHVPDPPPNVNFSAVEASAHARRTTARERLTLHQTEPACAGCHKVMDPLGLTLENFDGVGAWRTREGGLRIDTSGSLDGTDFTTTAGLAQALRNHPETPRCLVERLYKSAVGRDLEWKERKYLDWLIASFRSDGYRVPALMRRIATSENFFTISRGANLVDRRPAGGINGDQL